MAEYLGFDTETTGVNTARDRIVTACLIHRTDSGDEVRNWLLDPEVEIPLGATQVHGITTAYAREHGQNATEGLEEIASALAAALADGVPVVVFNASYDLPLLEAELKRHGLPTLHERLGGEPAPVLDPLVVDRAVDRYRKGKRNLAALCAVYGLPEREDYHSADGDVTATLDLWDAISRKYPDLPEVSSPEFQALQKNMYREWATHYNEWIVSSGQSRHPFPLEWPF